MSKEWKKIETNAMWDFEEDKELIGVFMGAETEVGPNASNVYTFRKADNTLISVWGNTILDSRFKNLVKGEEVKVEYKGKSTSPKTGRTYHNFDVSHREAEFKEIRNEDIPVIEEGIDVKEIPF